MGCSLLPCLPTALTLVGVQSQPLRPETVMRRHSLLVLLVSLALWAPNLLADVIVVDAAGGGAATTIQAGIDLAAEGDVVLVRPGVYNSFLASFSITGKGVSVVGDEGGEIVAPLLRIRQVPAGSTVIVRNLRVEDNAALPTGGTNIRVTDCVGAVVLEDVEAAGRDGVFNPLFQLANPGEVAFFAENSDGVVLVRCTFKGGDGLDTDALQLEQPGRGERALTVSFSSVAVYECDLVGGAGGGDAFHGNAGRNGAAALAITQGQVYVSGGSLLGGAGGGGCSVEQAALGCQGGDGIGTYLVTEAKLVDVAVHGGAGGALDGGGSAAEGLDVNVVGGVALTYPGTARELELPAVLREFESGALTVRGLPGDVVGIFFAFEALYFPLGGAEGVFVPGVPLFGPIVLGPLGGAGELVVPFNVPGLQGLDGLLHTVQVFTVEPDGSVHLSNPTNLLLVAQGL